MRRLSTLIFCIVCVCGVVQAHKNSVYRWGSDTGRIVKMPIVVGCTGEDPEDPYQFGLNQRVIVHVHNLDSLLKVAENPSNIALVLENVRLDGIRAYAVNRWTEDVYFKLTMDDYSEANQKAWALVVGSPSSSSKMVSVSVANTISGLSIVSVVNKFNIVTDKNVIKRVGMNKGFAAKFRLVTTSRLIWAILLFCFMGVVVWWAIKKTSMLRVSTMQKFGPGEKPPFSLAVSQMAFWYAVIINSEIFLWVVTDIVVPFPASVLGILGVSTVTNLTAMTIDSRRESEKMARNGAPYEPSKSFWRDLANDSTNQPALQRVQIMVWTLLFGMYYMFDVYRSVSIPDIDTSMLVLMGLASSAYVGGKVLDPGAK